MSDQRASPNHTPRPRTKDSSSSDAPESETADRDLPVSASPRLRSVHQGKGRKIPFKSKLKTGEPDAAVADSSPDPGFKRSESPVRPDTANAEPAASVPDAGGQRRGKEPRRGFWVLVLVIGTGILGWCVLCGFGAGYWFGRSSSRDAKVIAALSSETESQVSDAMAKLRSGSASEALQILQAAKSASPKTPSLAYLAGLAALQAGDMPLAEKLTMESIKSGERVSDALALRAVLNTSDRSKVKLGDPKVRAEEILQGAIAADPANPYPYVELSTLLRSRGRTSDAAAALRLAKSRLQPFDSHTVVAVTLALMEMENAAPESPPKIDPSSGDAASLFSLAYGALRRGEFSEAAAILKQCRTLLSPDLFDYLMNDPALRKFVDQKELREFFAQ